MRWLIRWGCWRSGALPLYDSLVPLLAKEGNGMRSWIGVGQGLEGETNG